MLNYAYIDPSLDQKEQQKWTKEKCAQVKSLLKDFGQELSSLEESYAHAITDFVQNDPSGFIDYVNGGASATGFYSTLRAIEAYGSRQAITFGGLPLTDNAGPVTHFGRTASSTIRVAGRVSLVIGVALDVSVIIDSESSAMDKGFAFTNIGLAGMNAYAANTGNPWIYGPVAAGTLGWTGGQFLTTQYERWSGYYENRLNDHEQVASEVYPVYSNLKDAYDENCPGD